VQKDFEASIRQGEQAQGRSWRLAKEKTFGVCGKEKKRMKCEEVVSSCVWEVFMERL
jgi:hypothetical protein